jgi:hypothetical protein
MVDAHGLEPCGATHGGSSPLFGTVFCGPMGSGKTTIANHYRSFSAKTAVLHVDNFKSIFDHFEKEARPEVIQGDHQPLGPEAIAMIAQKLLSRPVKHAVNLDTESKTIDQVIEQIDGYLKQLTKDPDQK